MRVHKIFPVVVVPMSLTVIIYEETPKFVSLKSSIGLSEKMTSPIRGVDVSFAVCISKVSYSSRE